MNIQEALNIFNLSGELNEKDIKTTYKKLALKYHPDRNPLGNELIQQNGAQTPPFRAGKSGYQGMNA